MKGTALAWFKFYLASRQQFVTVEEGMSSRRPLLRGVPQGSLLGSLLYLVYTAPIADIIKKHDLLYHLYADDTQLYISFNTDCCADLDEAKLRVERCVEEIDLWMCKTYWNLIKTKLNLSSWLAPNFEIHQILNNKFELEMRSLLLIFLYVT